MAGLLLLLGLVVITQLDRLNASPASYKKYKSSNVVSRDDGKAPTWMNSMTCSILTMADLGGKLLLSYGNSIIIHVAHGKGCSQIALTPEFAEQLRNDPERPIDVVWDQVKAYNWTVESGCTCKFYRCV